MVSSHDHKHLAEPGESQSSPLPGNALLLWFGSETGDFFFSESRSSEGIVSALDLTALRQV